MKTLFLATVTLLFSISSMFGQIIGGGGSGVTSNQVVNIITNGGASKEMLSGVNPYILLKNTTNSANNKIAGWQMLGDDFRFRAFSDNMLGVTTWAKFYNRTNQTYGNFSLGNSVDVNLLTGVIDATDFTIGGVSVTNLASGVTTAQLLSESNVLWNAKIASTNGIKAMAYQPTNGPMSFNFTNYDKFTSGGIDNTGVSQPNITTGPSDATVGGWSNTNGGAGNGIIGGVGNSVTGGSSGSVGGGLLYISGNDSAGAGGYGNLITGTYAFAGGGFNNSISGDEGFEGASVSSFATNTQAVVLGSSSSVAASLRSAVYNSASSTAFGAGSIVMGGDSSDTTIGGALVFGPFLRGSGQNSFLFGAGIDATHRITNSTANSFGVGFGNGNSGLTFLLQSNNSIFNGSFTLSGGLYVTNTSTNTFIATNGVAYIPTGSLGIRTSSPKKAIDVAGGGLRLVGAASSTLTGTADPTASTTLVGTGTLFLTELLEGDRITINGETRMVTGVATDTSLTVDVAFTDTASASITKLHYVFSARPSNNIGGMLVDDRGWLHQSASTFTTPAVPHQISGTAAGTNFDAILLRNSSTVDGSGTAIYMGYGTAAGGLGIYGARILQVGNAGSTLSSDLNLQVHNNVNADNAGSSWISGITIARNTGNVSIPKTLNVTGVATFTNTVTVQKDITANSFIGQIFTTNASSTFSTNYSTLFVDSAGGAVLITLPTAVGNAGRQLEIIDFTGNAAANNITVTNSGGQTISGATSKVINANYGGYRVVSNNTNWFGRSMSP